MVKTNWKDNVDEAQCCQHTKTHQVRKKTCCVHLKHLDVKNYIGTTKNLTEHGDESDERKLRRGRKREVMRGI